MKWLILPEKVKTSGQDSAFIDEGPAVWDDGFAADGSQWGPIESAAVTAYLEARRAANPNGTCYAARDPGTIINLTGVKSLIAVGSMAAGSNQLVLTSNPGFLVGDQIIVEIGGEAGAGLRGTVGVGGVWPTLSYANSAAMLADTSKPNFQYAYLVDTGEVYQWVSGVWVYTLTYGAYNYYVAKAIPRSMVATISNIASLTLTLDKTASVATTGAFVYYDNRPYINTQIDSVSGSVKALILLPAGEYAISNRININLKDRITLAGQGMDSTTLFTPGGVDNASLRTYSSSNIIVMDLHLVGNARFNGFGLQWNGEGFPSVTDFDVPQGYSYPRGVIFDQSTDCLAYRCRVTDAWHMFVGASFSTNIWSFDCEAYLTEGFQTYIQWLFHWSDSTGGGAVDPYAYSPVLTAGFNLFRSDGAHFVRPVGVNAAMAVNSSGNWIIDRPRITITPMSRYSVESFDPSNPLINVNSNIQPPNAAMQMGGTIKYPVIIVQGYVDASNRSPTAIIINADNPNVAVLGGYPANPSLGGYIAHPTVTWGSATGINSSGVSTTIDGMRVVGTNTNTSWGNIRSTGAGGVVRNCVADRIATGGTQTSNQTNAAFATAYGSPAVPSLRLGLMPI